MSLKHKRSAFMSTPLFSVKEAAALTGFTVNSLNSFRSRDSRKPKKIKGPKCTPFGASGHFKGYAADDLEDWLTRLYPDRLDTYRDRLREMRADR